jgi:hypothetical protein
MESFSIIFKHTRILIFLKFDLLSKNLKIKIYGTIILPVVLYGCETWSPTLRADVTGEWRKLHNEELNDLFFSPNIVQVIN